MFKSLLKSTFVRNVILVASGTAGAQAITLVFSPIITRLYGPEAFGLLGAFTAVLAVVMPIAAFTYPIAIVLPKSDDDAKGLVKLSVRIALVVALLLGILFLTAGEQIAILLNMETIAGFMYLIPLAMLFSALQQVMQQWLIRKKQFKTIARIAVSQSLILNCTKAGVGLFNPVGAVLITLATLGNGLYAIQLWLGAKKWVDWEAGIDQPSKQKVSLYGLAYNYRDFPYYRAPQIIVNAISQSLPILILASFFGPAVAGFFALGKSTLSAPATLIGSSVGNVFYAKISEIVNQGGNPINLLHKATLVTFLIGLGPFSSIILFGPIIFEFVFGSQWYIAGQYAQWIALWVLFSLSARAVIAIIPAVKIQGVFLLHELFFLGLKAITLVVAGMLYKNALLAVALYSLVTASSYVSLYLIVCFLSRKS